MFGRLLSIAALFVAATAHAQDTTTSSIAIFEIDPALLDQPLDVTVTAKRPITAASAMTIRARDFELRPVRRPADVLSVAPGLFVAQHAGGGKANQYFLRGFDADHGTDVLLSLDGVPVNLPSHGHGQGYADFNWLIPEIVEKIEVYKGPYFAELGDFSTAGAINLVTRKAESKNSVALAGGSFATLRSTLLSSPDVGEWKPLVAAELYHTAGPFQRGEDLNRYSAFGKLSRDIGEGGKLSIAATSYASGWQASGQIPLREVNRGALDAFGSVSDDDGGKSQRHSAYANYQQNFGESSKLSLMAYAVHYRFQLFSDFTFFSRDPVNGDLIEQGDVRTFGGFSGKYSFLEKLGDSVFETSFGLQLRGDSIDNALYYDKDRARLQTVVDAEVAQASGGLWASEDISWTPWLRTVLGARADYYNFAVEDKLAGADGHRDAWLLSPKASVILTPIEQLELYLNFGRGFHSNDARGVVRAVDPVTPLTTATGYEVGFRTELFDRLDIAAAAFVLDLSNESVWVGDEGTTEARGPTRRLGLETEARLKLLDWLWADLDVTLSRGTFTANGGNADAIALAPKLTVSGGLSARHESGLYGRFAAFVIGDRDATEDRFLQAEGFTRLDATLGFEHSSFEVSLSVQNLLNTQWREAQFANVSRLAGERSAASCTGGSRAVVDGGEFAGCEDLHFTPGSPFNLQASVAMFF